MVSIGMVVMGAADMGRAVRFWAAALRHEVREGGAGADWSSLTPAGGLGTGIGLQRSDTQADAHPRCTWTCTRRTPRSRPPRCSG